MQQPGVDRPLDPALDQALDQVDRLLASPTPAALDRACALMRGLLGGQKPAPGSARIRRIAKLLEWARQAREAHWRLRNSAPGYGPDGVHAAAAAPTRVAVRG
jgi:hypothetical protein